MPEASRTPNPTIRGGGAWANRSTELLLAVPLVATILIATVRGSRHFWWDWPTHAHHHLVAHIATAVGLSLVALLTLAPLRRREPWAWWIVAIAGVAVFGGYWLGNLTVGYGMQATLPNTAQTVLSTVYAAGLIRAWSTLR